MQEIPSDLWSVNADLFGSHQLTQAFIDSDKSYCYHSCQHFFWMSTPDTEASSSDRAGTITRCQDVQCKGGRLHGNIGYRNVNISSFDLT